jgi:hypothetical protein
MALVATLRRKQATPAPTIPPQRQPNEFDKRRIERKLQDRKRYRYVTPRVIAEASGYRIESPCCSRTIDPQGGTVDVALLHYDAETGAWELHAKDHAAGGWHLHSLHTSLGDAVCLLAEDSAKDFWK